MQSIKLLATLQQIDLELDADRRQFAANKEAMQPFPELQQQARKVKQLQAQVEKWRKERRQRDEKVAEQTAKISSLEQQLYGGRIKDVREQVAMQQNIEAQKRHLGTLEDAALEAMLEQEEAEKTLAAEQATFDAMKQAWMEKRAALEKDQEAIVQHARKLKARREKVVATLPAADLQKYEALRKKLGGLAIARLEGKSCGGCGAALPTSVVQKVHEGQVVKCPICGRLLYD
jgi:predicted  nucleic acid-binding Zn-ribbon protein